ncbi:MAG: hypothetical protein FWG92_07550 [Leptospirales bacterium]|nr:hypothetical protein [Leptospirales bacterium]
MKRTQTEKIFLKRLQKKVWRAVAILSLPAAALLLVSCASQRLPFMITAQYADRPVLIGQYKRPGEKIDPVAAGIPFESKQGTAVLNTPPQENFSVNKLSRDILMLNPKKTDAVIIQEIRVRSSTWDTSAAPFANESTVKGKILGDLTK